MHTQAVQWAHTKHNVGFQTLDMFSDALIVQILSRWKWALVEKHGAISSLKYSTQLFNLCNTVSSRVTSILHNKPKIVWSWYMFAMSVQLSSWFTIMCSWLQEIGTALTCFLNCGRDSFLLKTEADYLDEKAADLEMYSKQYVITTQSAQTAAICHKLRLLLATLHSNMWPNLDEQPLSKYRVEWCHF